MFDINVKLLLTKILNEWVERLTLINICIKKMLDEWYITYTNI